MNTAVTQPRIHIRSQVTVDVQLRKYLEDAFPQCEFIYLVDKKHKQSAKAEACYWPNDNGKSMELLRGINTHLDWA